MTRLPLVALAFLLSLPAARPATFVVSSSADSGAGTIRQAILDANSGACASPCEIAFERDMRVDVLSELPALTASSVTIRGARQQGPSRVFTIVNGSRAGADAAGLRISGAREVDLFDMTFEEFADGIVIRDSSDIEIARLALLSNRRNGALVQRTNRVRMDYCNVGVLELEPGRRERRPNGGHGIHLDHVKAAAIAANIIQNNGGHGIAITGDSVENYLEFNEFGENGGLAIDYDGDGPPRPVIDDARSNRGSTRVSGHISGLPNTRYDVSIWTVGQDGEPRRWHSGPKPVITGANGRGTFAMEFPEVIGPYIVALASRFISEYAPFAETSEFSAMAEVLDRPVTIEVTSTADSGPGSLRAAIEEVNATECSRLFICEIAFRIATPPNGIGVWTIRPLTPLPAIQRSGVLLDAETQTKFAGDTNPAGPEVEIDGRSCGGVCNGLVLDARTRTVEETLVRHFIVSGFSGHGIAAIAAPRANLSFMHGVRIESCYIGTDAVGWRAVPNGGSGVHLTDGYLGVSGSTISGNAGDGITTVSTTDYGAGVAASANRIGTERAGLFPLPNGGNGISSNDGIGAAGNVIAFNIGAGILLTGPGGQSAILQNSIHSNGGRGIESQRPFALAAPAITSARFENGKTRIRYTLAAPKLAFPFFYRIELFTSSFTDASGRGEAKRFLVSGQHDNSRGEYEIEVGENLIGRFVTMTATHFDSFSTSYNSSSEFGASVQVTAENCRGESTTLEAPASGAETSGVTTFRWSAVPGAVMYRLWVMKPGGAPAVVFQGATPVANLMLEPGTYEWWVETRFDCYGPQTEHRSLVVR